MNRLTARRALPGLATTLACLPALAADPGADALGISTASPIAMSAPQTPPAAATRPSAPIIDDLYFLADVGVAIPQDADIDNIASTNTSLGLSGAKLSLDPGVRFDLGLGYKITDWFAVEVASGLIWNGVDKVEGTVTDTPAGFIGANIPLAGGSGNVYNIPILFNGQFRIPVGKDLKVVLGGGIGTIWSDASVSGITTPLVPGLQASVNGSSWAFAYQGNAGVEWQLSWNVALGVRYAFLGTTELNYGAATFNTPLLVGTADIKANALYTNSIMANLRFEF